MLVTDTAGATLAGAIDGQNRAYTLSLDPDIDSVAVLVNGRRKLADLDDGYSLPGGRQVLLKEALLPGDTLQVEYQLAGEGSLGGAPNVGHPSLMVDQCGASAPTPRVSVASLSAPRVRVRAACACVPACACERP